MTLAYRENAVIDGKSAVRADSSVGRALPLQGGAPDGTPQRFRGDAQRPGAPGQIRDSWDTLEALPERIQRKVFPCPISGCWLWAGGTRDGYGRVSLDGQTLSVHRLVYEVTHGPIPDGLQACHHCDNPACCNPDHIFLGTLRDNHADKRRKGRAARGSRSGLTHLTEDDVRAMLPAIERGETSKAIAALYGVSADCVRNIRKGRSWSHVTGITGAGTDDRHTRWARARRLSGSPLLALALLLGGCEGPSDFAVGWFCGLSLGVLLGGAL